MHQPVGKVIKELRVQRKLSQEELADKVNERFDTNLNKGMISKWENGLGDPRLDYVRCLAIFFDVSLDYMLDVKKDIEPETIAAHHDGEEWTDEEIEEIEKFKEFVRMKRNQQG